MGFLGFLSRWLGGGAADAALDLERAESAAAVERGTLEPPPPGELLAPPAADARPDTEEAWWIPRGEPTLEDPLARRSLDSIDGRLHDRLRAILDDPNPALPQLPHIAQRALVMLRNDECRYRELAEVVGQDPVLSAEILRLANSAAYRGLAEIRNLDMAFARVGQRKLRGYILGFTVRKVVSIRTGGPSRTLGEELWQRAMVSSTLMTEWGRRFGLPHDDLFLSGLLHDIGMMAVLRIVHDYESANYQNVPRALFDRLCFDWHEHIGTRLASAWDLPDPLPELIGSHHRAPADDDPLRTYRSLIQLSDVICAMLGYAPYVPYDFFEMPCVKRLNIVSDAATKQLLAAIPTLLRERVESP